MENKENNNIEDSMNIDLAPSEEEPAVLNDVLDDHSKDDEHLTVPAAHHDGDQPFDREDRREDLEQNDVGYEDQQPPSPINASADSPNNGKQYPFAEGTGVCKKTSIGGQALIEGLMMLGPEKQAIAVRDPNGEIILDVKDRSKFANKLDIPFIRGVIRLVTQLKTGVRAIGYSADIAMKEEEDKEGEEKKVSHFDQFASRHPNLIMGFSLVFSLSLSIALFILLPSALTDLIRKLTGFGAGEQRGVYVFALSFIEGLVRMAIFLSYLWLTSFSKDMKRVWMYHGSEHKTIAAYEAGLPLTVENIRKMSRFHPRCGTSFLFLVMLVSILAFAIVGRYTLWLNILIRLALLPLVAGISYEIIRFAGAYDNIFSRVISKPGLALQRLTTAEPEDEMLEVAIVAMAAVIPENPDRDRW